MPKPDNQPTYRRTVFKQAVDDMHISWCPVTGNLPTKMTRTGFDRACAAAMEKAKGKACTSAYAGRKYTVCNTCQGKTTPKGLEIIELTEMEEPAMPSKPKTATCDVCGRSPIKTKKNHGVQACSRCMAIQASISKNPQIVAAEYARITGLPLADTAAEDSHYQLLEKIADAVGLTEEDRDLNILPDLAAALNTDKNDLIIQVDNLNAANEDLANQLMEKESECETLANRLIKQEQKPSKPSITDPLTTTQQRIAEKCEALKTMLLHKNKAYGDSAVNPLRIFSAADPSEQIRVRIDDKLSRIMRGSRYGHEDTIMDLAGYFVLLMILTTQQPAEHIKGAA